MSASMVLFFAALPSVSADMIEFTFGGDLVENFWGPPTGESFVFSYLFDSTTTDASPGDNNGNYPGVIDSFDAQFGATSLNGIPDSSFISFQLWPFEHYISTVAIGVFELSIIMEGWDTSDGSHYAFETDALPTTLDLNDFVVGPRGFRVLDTTLPGSFWDQTIALGEVMTFSSHVVPTPSGLLLGAIGLLCVCFRNRHFSPVL